MAQSTETQVNLKINRVPSKSVLEDMVANNQLQPNQLYMIESEQGDGLVALQTKTLWTNPSPSSSFAAQTITTLDMSQYDYLLFNFRGANNVEWGFSQLVKKELGHRLFYGDGAGQRVCIRNFTINSSTSITFEAAIYNSASSTTELVPLQIIGIKLINSPQDIYGWVDGQATVITETQTTTETNIDMSSFISDYDSSGEYELLLNCTVYKTSNIEFYLGSDIISTYKQSEAGGSAQSYNRFTCIVPIKKILKYRLSGTSLNGFGINLLGYRRIK